MEESLGFNSMCLEPGAMLLEDLTSCMSRTHVTTHAIYSQEFGSSCHIHFFPVYAFCPGKAEKEANFTVNFDEEIWLSDEESEYMPEDQVKETEVMWHNHVGPTTTLRIAVLVISTCIYIYINGKPSF